MADVPWPIQTRQHHTYLLLQLQLHALHAWADGLLSTSETLLRIFGIPSQRNLLQFLSNWSQSWWPRDCHSTGCHGNASKETLCSEMRDCDAFFKRHLATNTLIPVGKQIIKKSQSKGIKWKVEELWKTFDDFWCQEACHATHKVSGVSTYVVGRKVCGTHATQKSHLSL